MGGCFVQGATAAGERLHARRSPLPDMTRSEAERRLKRLIAKAGLPAPRTNVTVCGYEVDL